MRKILESCPTCSSHNLVVTELRCSACDTTVRSSYRPTVFSQLSAENLRFIEIFVKNKGNVKEMERELGVSYWTIRSRLDDIIATLDFAVVPEPAAPSVAARRQAILDQLEAGTLTVQQAAEQLDALTG